MLPDHASKNGIWTLEVADLGVCNPENSSPENHSEQFHPVKDDPPQKIPHHDVGQEVALELNQRTDRRKEEGMVPSEYWSGEPVEGQVAGGAIATPGVGRRSEQRLQADSEESAGDGPDETPRDISPGVPHREADEPKGQSPANIHLALHVPVDPLLLHHQLGSNQALDRAHEPDPHCNGKQNKPQETNDLQCPLLSIKNKHTLVHPRLRRAKKPKSSFIIAFLLSAREGKEQ